MAGTSTSAVAVYHGTSSATTSDVDIITMNRSSDRVEISNRNSTGNLFVRTDGATPVALAKENYIIKANSSDVISTNRADSTAAAVVRIISDTASLPYSVTVR
jgi:hypothetical protein